MTNYETADFYGDASLVDDPHGYFDYLREKKGPVTRLPHRNVVAVTGFEETVQIMLDPEHFSSINAVMGPIPPLPFEVQGDDISGEIHARRADIMFGDSIITETGERHTYLRSVIATLFTPSRLKFLEPKLRETADALIDEFIADGRVNLVSQYGGPYATLVIAHVLGVPDDGRQQFRELLKDIIPAEIGAPLGDMMDSPLAKLGKKMFGYIAQRRIINHPLLRWSKRLFGSSPAGKEDVLTDLALAKYPDGSTPSLADVTGLGAFIFGAGQDTTNRLLANALRVIATRPDIQQELRDNPKRIPDFVEEVLRIEGSIKSGGRMCQKTVTLGGVEIKAGTTILLSHMAANRDPRRFENPAEFNMDRPRVKEHVAFGRGAHTCIGAALARAEMRVSIEQLLARLGNIRLAEEHRGPDGADKFEYEPTYMLNALKYLHLEFDRI